MTAFASQPDQKELQINPKNYFMPSYILAFSKINSSDIAKVGGKNASLGEMFNNLSSSGINIPDGFATSSEAFWHFIDYNKLREPLKQLLESLDRKQYTNLKET